MAAKWDLTTVGELIAEYGGSIKTGPFGTMLKAVEYSRRGVPLISVGEIGYGALRVTDETPRAPREVVERLSQYLLEAGDIVLSRKGAVDRSALVKPSEAGWFLGSDGIRLRLPSVCDARFVAYQFQSQYTRSWLLQHATGTTMASLNQAIIERVPMVMPPIESQRRIADILGTLDDKIELNRQISETLEAMARALFKSWFVDFDPVRAKAEGRDTGLAQPVADLFPDRLVDAELDKIPESWNVRSIGDLAIIAGGTTPSTAEPAYWEGGTHHWATPKDLSGLAVPVLLDTERKITDAGLSQIGSGLLPRGTVLLSSRAPIGYLAVAEVPVSVNQGFIAITPKPSISNLFLMLWATTARDAILSRANGSTFLEISKTNFRPIPIISPPAEVMQAFDNLVRVQYERLVSCVRESRTLAAIRDTLLPKLISGELRVKDTECYVGQVG